MTIMCNEPPLRYWILRSKAEHASSPAKSEIDVSTMVSTNGFNSGQSSGLRLWTVRTVLYNMYMYDTTRSRVRQERTNTPLAFEVVRFRPHRTGRARATSSSTTCVARHD